MSQHPSQTSTDRETDRETDHDSTRTDDRASERSLTRSPLVDPAAPRLPLAVRDAGLLAARVLLGVIMIAHGWQKFVTNGLDATGGAFAKMGVPMPEVSAALAASVELGGGILLVLGLFTPIAGLAVAAVLAGAFWFVHMGQGLFATDGGWELVAALGLAAVVFALVGPGRFSLDALLRRRRATA